MTVLSSVEQYFQAILSGLKPSSGVTKSTNELLQFLEEFPFGQVLAAAMVEGTNPLLDITAVTAIVSDIVNSFFANKTVPTAAASTAIKVGVPATTVAQIIFTGVPSTSRGR